MQYSRLISCLSLFSQESLRQYLGKDLVVQLQSEWENMNGPLTKKRLAEMIVQLNGAALLKKPSFRKDVLMHISQSELAEIFSLLPASKQAGANTPLEQAAAIASLSWTASDANLKLLNFLGISVSIFDTRSEDSTIVVTHQAEKRFFELLDYQFVIKQRVLTELNRQYPLKRMLVHMPTGTGKTKTSMHTLVHYYNFSLKKRGAVIWLAHTVELLQQAYETFASVWQHLGDGQINAYKLWGKRKVSIPHQGFQGILFCGIQKLQSIYQSQPELFAQILQDVRLIIFDEAHKSSAPETRQLIDELMTIPAESEDRSLLGLTATPGRTTLTSEENKLLSDVFENRLISIDIDVVNQVNMSQTAYLNHPKETNIIHYFQQSNILAKIKKEQLMYTEQFTPAQLRSIKVQMLENGYADFSRPTLEMIGRNRSRNTAIMNKLRELFTDQVPTIVFACSVAHAKLLSFMLSLEDIPNALVLGEMNPVDRAKSIAAFKDWENPVNILINYEVLTTGFDSTNIQCVFITRPTQSIVLYSQMLGRGLRGPMMGGNKECLLIDIKDNLGRFDADMAFSHFDTYWN